MYILVERDAWPTHPKHKTQILLGDDSMGCVFFIFSRPRVSNTYGCQTPWRSPACTPPDVDCRRPPIRPPSAHPPAQWHSPAHSQSTQLLNTSHVKVSRMHLAWLSTRQTFGSQQCERFGPQEGTCLGCHQGRCLGPQEGTCLQVESQQSRCLGSAVSSSQHYQGACLGSNPSAWIRSPWLRLSSNFDKMNLLDTMTSFKYRWTFKIGLNPKYKTNMMNRLDNATTHICIKLQIYRPGCRYVNRDGVWYASSLCDIVCMCKPPEIQRNPNFSIIILLNSVCIMIPFISLTRIRKICKLRI